MTFGDLFWSLIVFYFWFMLIWIFIRIFADIFHRRDITGGMKAVWIIALIFLPFLGALIYMISAQANRAGRGGCRGGQGADEARCPATRRPTRSPSSISCAHRARSPRRSSTRPRPRRSPAEPFVLDIGGELSRRPIPLAGLALA